ncbi:MAG: hypothetical protein ACRC1Z_04945 [Waterburya sp.]
MIIAKFRHKYPQGSLVSELIEIDGGTYIVKASVQIDNLVLATALAGATTVEAAEDAAKERAIATLCLDQFLDHQPDISPPIPFQTHTASVEAQPSVSLSLSSQSENASEGTSNHKIVNFSKPQAEVVNQSQDLNPETIVPIALVADLPSEVELDLAPQFPQVNSDLPPETNLFGDTFIAETPAALSTTENEVDPASNLISPELEAMDFNEIKQKTDIEIKRLSWTKDQGREFLMSHYGKKSRLHLTDEQLLEFLRYLETLPNPVK